MSGSGGNYGVQGAVDTHVEIVGIWDKEIKAGV